MTPSFTSFLGLNPLLIQLQSKKVSLLLTSCRLVNRYKRFGRTYCIHLQNPLFCRRISAVLQNIFICLPICTASPLERNMKGWLRNNFLRFYRSLRNIIQFVLEKIWKGKRVRKESRFVVRLASDNTVEEITSACDVRGRGMPCQYVASKFPLATLNDWPRPTLGAES